MQKLMDFIFRLMGSTPLSSWAQYRWQDFVIAIHWMVRRSTKCKKEKNKMQRSKEKKQESSKKEPSKEEEEARRSTPSPLPFAFSFLYLFIPPSTFCSSFLFSSPSLVFCFSYVCIPLQLDHQVGPSPQYWYDMAELAHAQGFDWATWYLSADFPHSACGQGGTCQPDMSNHGVNAGQGMKVRARDREIERER